MRTRIWAIAGGLLLCLAGNAFADRDRTFILATGRRDPRMYAIDLQKALRPENQNTPNAIVSRSKTALDRLDGKLLGDPANVVISEDLKTAFVVNHHGAVDNDAFLQHGGRGGIAVMNVKRMIVVPNFRANNVSIVNLELALAGLPGAEVARNPLTRPADVDNVVRPARPKGSAVTSDGRYAVISGGPRTAFVPSGTVWIIDLRTRTVVGTVTGVGNDPYGLALVEGSEDD